MDEQQSPSGSTPQYSPDGKWWWDGSRWAPVGQAATAGPAKPAATAGRRRKWPWVVGALVLLSVIGIIGAAANGGSGQSAAAKPTSPTHVAAATAPKATAKPVAAAPAGRDGSCAPQPCANDNYGWIVTVSNVHYGADGGQFDQPESGNVFVTADVTFTNKLDQEQNANPIDFVLQDGAGIKHTVRPMVDGPCQTWDAVNLTKGATLTKCVSFEATSGKPTGLSLVWTPSGFGGGYTMKLS
jgi:hypothetical protein